MSLGKWIGLVAFIVSLYILWQIRQLLLLVFAAIVLANALNILVQRFYRSGLKRSFAVLLSIFLLLTFGVGFYWLIVPPFAEQIQQLVELVPKGIDQLNTWSELLKARIDTELINEYIPSIDELIRQIQPIANRLLGGGFSFVSNSLVVIGQLLLVITLTVMFLADPQPYRGSFVRLFPSFYRRRVDEILSECQTSLQGWLVGILFNMFVIALLSFTGLVLLGIPLALSQAALAGLLTFIPNIGPTLSVVPPIAIALLETPWKAIAVLILYIIIQQVESNLLTPIVMKQQVSLLPAVTLLAQVFFATLFGFVGLFLALPLTVVVQVWLKEVLIKDVLDGWTLSKNKKQNTKPARTVLAVAQGENHSANVGTPETREDSQTPQDTPQINQEVENDITKEEPHQD
ncbi:AI-2E family transporter [Lyngbya aestuarii]|uniref:AI-2E family transporter n=1 Tax=Lyngbya aestuarii TaxID=118322 RepID=UPI00403D94E3